MRRQPFARLLVFTSILWLSGGLLLWALEGLRNPDFDTVPKALWNIAVYLFSGLDSGVPRTVPGKIVVTLVLVLSLGVAAVLTGTIASFLVERSLWSRKRMPSHDLRGHIVICNWNDKAVPIIRELHAAIVKDRRPVVIVSDSPEAAALPEEDELPEFQDVYLVRGDPASEVMLRRASAHTAHSVIILADPADGDLADAKSILIAMAVASICTQLKVPKTHVCVEGISPRNVEHLRRAKADEIVAASDFAMMLLAQSALAHGLSRVYRDLLTVSEETNEVYIVPVPEEFIGKTFCELGAAMFMNRDEKNPAILIGAAKGSQLVINPRPGQLAPFQRGDQAVVIAFERPERLV